MRGCRPKRTCREVIKKIAKHVILKADKDWMMIRMVGG